MIIKFKTPELAGYGFDVAADRVVRFNKHPDGTYLNTRATYSINTRQFTHFDLRTTAIKDPVDLPVVSQVESELTTKDVTAHVLKILKWSIIGLVILSILLVGQCSFDTSFTSSVTTTEE